MRRHVASFELTPTRPSVKTLSLAVLFAAGIVGLLVGLALLT